MISINLPTAKNKQRIYVEELKKYVYASIVNLRFSFAQKGWNWNGNDAKLDYAEWDQ